MQQRDAFLNEMLGRIPMYMDWETLQVEQEQPSPPTTPFSLTSFPVISEAPLWAHRILYTTV